MRVLKIEAEGLTTSFRYPFFMVGRQPSFDMPPPATIYGHICSAAGDWLDPVLLRFGYWFSHAGTKHEDLEHFHSTEIAGGTFALGGAKVAKNVEAGVQPTRREFLLQPRLVLYLANLDLADAFRSPRYAVVLGRSQDLFTYTRVAEIDLIETEQAYIERTLLPGGPARWPGLGMAIAMPRFIDYRRNRQVTFGQYQMLQGRASQEDLPRHPDHRYLVDPETEERNGCHRAVIFHTFVDPR